MSFLRSEPDIDTSVRKAISPDETAPKRKHVRACVVYTWDHRNGKAFWHAVRMLPIQDDPVMVFKALIVIHKVLHEGHRTVLREAQNHVNWIRSLAGPMGAGGGYRRLIEEYVRLLLFKLEFHRRHPDFNGTFEYEEYISLRNVDDPNEGFEACIDLMNLQDSIDDFQRVVFASVGAARRRSTGQGGMECRVSSLTAMVTESYGIYRFTTSMLRGLHQQVDAEALDTLRARYYSQHRRLRNFYFECQGVKYLVSLITIPELSKEPPDLLQSNDSAPSLPKRPRELQPMATGATTATLDAATLDASPQPVVPEPTGNWWQGQQPNIAAQQAEEERRMMEMELYQRQLEAERQQQAQLALQAQQQFEAEQQALLAAQQAQQEEFARAQQQMQYQGQAAVEQELSMLRAGQQEAESMLQQYDQRVQSLEQDLQQITALTQQQVDAKSQQIESLQEQVDGWRSKYEKLAKLYSQLRNEHLALMDRYRKAQTKAASAQEAVDKREKAERDLKAKNLELADLIRERDRARYELDKSRGQHLDEVERLERSVSLLNDRISDSDRTKAADVSAIVSSHAREISALEQQLAAREAELASHADRARDDEVDILKEQLAQMEDMVGGMSLKNDVGSILDAVLHAAHEHVQQALAQFDSPLESGNPNANPPYVLSICDTTVASTEQFADAFTQYIAEGDAGDPVQIITIAGALSGQMGNLLADVKGLAGLTAEASGDALQTAAGEAAANLGTFFASLSSEVLRELPDEDDRLELVITNQVEVMKYLQEVSNIVEGMLPKSVLTEGSLNQQVDGAMANLAQAVTSANQQLSQLLGRSGDYKAYDRKVNDAIIAAAVAITSAIGELIKASVDCQQEIVSKGKQGESPENYYKKNHRWTEGLISAARAVGSATNVLIETADGMLSGRGSPEELIVSSREVASSIVQLVASSRSKAGHQSKNQQSLETAGKNVSASCRALVSKVQDMISSNRPDPKKIDYSQLSAHGFKSASMEQQVEVLKLEQDLTLARNRLFEIRKLEYAAQEEEEDE